MKVSVACPTFEYYGRGVEVLDDMFRTIANQTLKDVEVVVSDHSRTDEIEDYCKKNEHNLDIKYLRNENGRGNPCINTNNAIDHCSGEVIKILQQDDFHYDTGDFTTHYTNNLSGAEDKCIVFGAWNTNDNGSNLGAGNERGSTSCNQYGPEVSATSKVRYTCHYGSTGSSNGGLYDYEGNYCATLGDLA